MDQLIRHVSSDSKKSNVSIAPLSNLSDFVDPLATSDIKKISRSLPSDLSPRKIAVVGATISGIISALELQQKGFDVTFLAVGSGLEGIEEVTLPIGKVDLGMYLTCEPDVFSNTEASHSRWIGSNSKFQKINFVLYDSNGFVPIDDNNIRIYRTLFPILGVDHWESKCLDLVPVFLSRPIHRSTLRRHGNDVTPILND